MSPVTLRLQVDPNEVCVQGAGRSYLDGTYVLEEGKSSGGSPCYRKRKKKSFVLRKLVGLLGLTEHYTITRHGDGSGWWLDYKHCTDSKRFTPYYYCPCDSRQPPKDGWLRRGDAETPSVAALLGSAALKHLSQCMACTSNGNSKAALTLSYAY